MHAARPKHASTNHDAGADADDRAIVAALHAHPTARAVKFRVKCTLSPVRTTQHSFPQGFGGASAIGPRDVQETCC
jgi:hypothetical protein